MLSTTPRTIILDKRPPTPPKKSSASKGNRNFFVGSGPNCATLETPEESPSSSAEYFGDSSGKRRKRVEFNLWAQLHKDGERTDLSAGDAPRRDPPSRDCNPKKSILKSTLDLITPQSANEEYSPQNKNLSTLLHSTVLHLASDLRASRLDAYTCLLGCLSAHEDVSEAKDLVDKVAEISSFIKRDVTARAGDGSIDTQLVTQALKLTTVLLYTKGTEAMLSDDFWSCILDQALASLENPESPKILIIHYMHLLEKQRFSTKVLQSDRIDRLLSALGSNSTRARGHRSICHRLNIYHRLVSQAKSLMILRSGKWLDHLVTGLLSSTKEIRIRAISFGFEAGLHLGTAGSVTKECIDLFDRSPPGGEKLASFCISRLRQMIALKESDIHVPQIWSIILLLLRGRRRQVEHWEHITSWLKVIQECLNSNQPHVKFQAFLAWNRYIYTINVDSSTSQSMARMLLKPISSQLERKSEDKNTRQAKQIARASYCSLLYYALRPSSSNAQIDRYWDLYVGQVVPHTFVSSTIDRNHACEILAALLHNDKLTRVWDENKVNLSGPTKPEDLLPLDPKWIRLNSRKILALFEALFEAYNWKNDSEADKPLLSAWKCFVSALGIAGSKEIKVSAEAISAVVAVLNFFKGILRSRNVDGATSTKLDHLKSLCQVTIAQMGHLPFNEPRISINSSHDFEASIETPSSHGSFRQSSLDSATGHLIDLVFAHDDCSNHLAVSAVFTTLVETNLKGSSSRQSQLKSLGSLCSRLPEDSQSRRTSPTNIYWRIIASSMCEKLRSSSTTVAKHNDHENIGFEYRAVIKVLEMGLQLSLEAISDLWQSLYRQLASNMELEVSRAAVYLALQESIALSASAVLAVRCEETVVQLLGCVLAGFEWQPGDMKALEKISVRLWGATVANTLAMTKRINNNLFQLIDCLLTQLYTNFDNIERASAISCLEKCVTAIRRCPLADRAALLQSYQAGTSSWLSDEQGRLCSEDMGVEQAGRLQEAVVASLSTGHRDQSRLLSEFQVLITSLLQSRHMTTLDKTVTWWNQTFSSCSALIYPEIMQRPLAKLQLRTEIHLPNFPPLDIGSLSPIHCFDSQDTEQDIWIRRPAAERRTPSKSLPDPAPQQSTMNPLAQSSNRKSERRSKSTPKAGLRHDDSQLQFAAIESSPIDLEEQQSQVLTGRQVEVRARQQREATACPKMGSSPQTSQRSEHGKLPKLDFSQSKSRDAYNDAEEDSPGLPPAIILNGFLGSSPTPSSGRTKSVEPFSDDGPPSSPPGMPSQFLQHNHDQDENATKISRDKLYDEISATKDQAGICGSPVLLPSGGEDEDCLPKAIAAQLEAIQPLAASSGSSSKQRSSQDECVDIMSSNAADTGKEDATNEMTVDPDGPVTPEPPEQGISSTALNGLDEATRSLDGTPRSSQVDRRMLTENDEVTAQLLQEMMAASQTSIRSGTSESTPPSNRKRKYPSNASSRKKARTSLDSGPAGTAARADRSEVVDCVLIHANSAPTDVDCEGLRVKEERHSPSPCLNRTVHEETTDHPDIHDDSHRRLRCTSTEVQRTGSRSHRAQRTGREPLPDGPIYLTADAAVKNPAMQTLDDEASFPTADGILRGLRELLGQVRRVRIQPEQERTMVGMLFETMHEVHEAGRRGQADGDPGVMAV